MYLDSFEATFNHFLLESTSSDPQMKKEKFKDYVRFTGPSAVYYDNTLYSPFLDLSNDLYLENLIDEQINYFSRLKKNFEWKIYSFNNQEKLEALLLKKSFKVERKSTVMYAPINLQLKVKNNINIVQAKEWKDFEKIAAIQEDVYGKNAGDFLKDLQNEALLPNSNLEVYIAEKNSLALSAAWTRHYGEISFFFGGATRRDARKLGSYSALVQHRITRAKERGAKFVVSECSADSEAVLEKIGFIKSGHVNVFVHSYV